MELPRSQSWGLTRGGGFHGQGQRMSPGFPWAKMLLTEESLHENNQRTGWWTSVLSHMPGAKERDGEDGGLLV